MQIDFVYDQAESSLPSGMVAALNYVASYYDALIGDAITVNIEVGYGEVTAGDDQVPVTSGGEGGVDGGADYSYAELVALLKTNASTAVAAQALSYLSSTEPSGGGEFFVSSAQEKAWGLTSSTATAIDGSIGFAVNGAGGVNYDFDPSNRAVSGEWDFIGIAEQEVAHALGRLTGLNGTSGGWMALDLFRYGSAGVLSHSEQSAAYFSLDGGTTDLGNYAASVDPSDWARGTAADSYDVVTQLGVENPVSTADIDELNAIGFETALPDDDVSGGGQTINLASYSQGEVNLFDTGDDADIVTGSNGTVELTNARASIAGGGDYVDFLDGGSGDIASLSGTDGDADHVLGSGGTVNLASSQVVVTGGGNAINLTGSDDAITLQNTAGVWDGVTGSDGSIALSSAQATFFGGGNFIEAESGAGDAVGLYNTSGTWDGVQGSGVAVYLDGAQTTISGGGDSVSFAAGTANAVGLYATAGVWDWVSGSNGVIYLTGAGATVDGGRDYVVFSGGADDGVTLTGTDGAWDGVAASNASIYVDGAQTTVDGASDFITLSGTGNAVGLYNTGAGWDGVEGSDATIYLTSARTTVSGGGDAVYFAGGASNYVGLYDTNGDWDGVFYNAGGVIYLTNAQTTVDSGGQAEIYFVGDDDMVGLSNTPGGPDLVSGSHGAIYLNSAGVELIGGYNTVSFSGSGLAELDGSNNTLLISEGIGGQDVVSGLEASDTIRFSAYDFANWSALQAHMSASGANTLITLNAADTVTIDNVAPSSLSASQFRFA